jgi:hypothetical protein
MATAAIRKMIGFALFDLQLQPRNLIFIAGAEELQPSSPGGTVERSQQEFNRPSGTKMEFGPFAT